MSTCNRNSIQDDEIACFHLLLLMISGYVIGANKGSTDCMGMT